RDHEARRRPHVPEHPPLSADDGARERPRRDALEAEGRNHRLRARPATCAAGGAPGRGARPRAAELLRAAQRRRRAGRVALLRRPAPPRGRAGARDRAEAAPARRADRGDEPAGDHDLHELRLEAARGAADRDPADRARHEGRDEHLQPRDGARLRREDRGRRAAGDPEGRAGDRGLPRKGGDAVSEQPTKPAEQEQAPEKTNGRSRNGEVVLRVDGIHTFYGTIEALKGITLEVRDGEVVTLIGANGAGKSTTLRSINGLNQPREGTIEFRGKDITRRPPHDIVGMGISQSPEGRRLFPHMSVIENLEMGAFQRNDRREIREDLDRVYGLFPRLAERKNQKAGTMSGGEQQMCAIGRALMARPQLLMLDEPSMGLAPIFVEKIFEIIDEINKQGTTILLVEQNALMALDAADRGYVLETGRVALADDAKNLRENEQVRKAYLGEEG